MVPVLTLILFVCAVIWGRQEGVESFPSIGWQQDGALAAI